MSRFVVEVVAGIVSTGFVGLVLYRFVEHRLRVGEQEARRTELARDVLTVIRDELARNREVVTRLETHLPSGALPYTAFEVTGWEIVAQSPVFTVLEPATTKALLEAYGRLRAANDQHALLFDLMYGPTSALSFLVAQATAQDPASQALRRIEERRAELRDRLLRRVADLEPYLERGSIQVDAELASYR